MCKRLICLAVVAVFWVAPVAARAATTLDAMPQQSNPPSETAPSQAPDLSDLVVQQVLQPLRTGIESQNIQMVLAVFDKKELNGYSDLQGQLQAFFQLFNEVQLRYQLLQVTADDGRGSATVEMQMDALPYDRSLPVSRRSTQMRLQLKMSSKGWKIASFTPADFFNAEYSTR